MLAVPEYREQYLQNLKTLAETSLSWETLGPFIVSQSKLIDESVKTETRGLASYEGFVAATSQKGASVTQERRFGPPRMSLKDFVDERHQFLIDYTPKASK